VGLTDFVKGCVVAIPVTLCVTHPVGERDIVRDVV
jgi:hypothetical protein